mmetsp:Transcript_6234/g.9187  ORF Transcript_6234/g.9187 Transcript_6234/m.9187 type:complete len:223 (+) Transcript_6234:62-730(+)
MNMEHDKSSLVEGAELDKLLETVTYIHIFKSIKNTALFTSRKLNSRIDRPSLDGVFRKSSLHQGLSERILGNSSSKPVSLLGKSFKRRCTGMDTVITLVGDRLQSESLPVIKNGLTNRSFRSLRRIRRSQQLTTEVLPAQLLGTPFNFIAVNASSSTNELAAHSHEECVEDVHLLVILGYKSTVKSSSELDNLGILPGIVQPSSITIEDFACLHGIAGTLLG